MEGDDSRGSTSTSRTESNDACLYSYSRPSKRHIEPKDDADDDEHDDNEEDDSLLSLHSYAKRGRPNGIEYVEVNERVTEWLRQNRLQSHPSDNEEQQQTDDDVASTAAEQQVDENGAGNVEVNNDHFGGNPFQIQQQMSSEEGRYLSFNL